MSDARRAVFSIASAGEIERVDGGRTIVLTLMTPDDREVVLVVPQTLAAEIACKIERRSAEGEGAQPAS